MYKYMTIATLSILTATAAAKGEWDVGIAGGWGMTKPSDGQPARTSAGASGRPAPVDIDNSIFSRIPHLTRSTPTDDGTWGR